MAVTVVATAKGASSNSYATLAEAESYLEGRVGTSTWDSATTDQKNRALVTATNRLEQEDYHGNVTDTNQRLKWPRSGTWDMDGRYYDQDTVPRPVKEAQYELALALVNGDLELKDTGLEAFRSARVGPMDVQPNLGREAGALPMQVRRLLAGLLMGSMGINVRAERA